MWSCFVPLPGFLICMYWNSLSNIVASTTFRCMVIFARGNKSLVFDIVPIGLSRPSQFQGETFRIDLFKDYVWKKAILLAAFKFMPRKVCCGLQIYSWILLIQHTVVPFTDVKSPGGLLFSTPKPVPTKIATNAGEKKSLSGLPTLPFRAQRLPTGNARSRQNTE